MDKEQFDKIIKETHHLLLPLNNKGIGFICYMWDKDGKLDRWGGGFQSIDADMGDAMFAIIRILKRFNIDPNVLLTVIKKVKQGKDKLG